MEPTEAWCALNIISGCHREGKKPGPTAADGQMDRWTDRAFLEPWILHSEGCARCRRVIRASQADHSETTLPEAQPLPNLVSSGPQQPLWKDGRA